MQRSLALLRQPALGSPLIAGRTATAVAGNTALRAPLPALYHASYTTGPSRRNRKLPTNTGINFVPQMEAWVVERFGKFYDVLEPGLNLLIPVVDDIRYVHSLKELIIEVPSQSAITMDNVTLHLDGVLYVKITDPFKASYGVEDPQYAVAQLAQTTMRSELGKLTLDSVFKERANLNSYIVDAINHAAQPWGVTCLRCEIRDISLPDRVVDDMQRQVSAERKKRASILESEGMRQAEINVAEGSKQSTVLASEASKEQQTNEAAGEAAAITARAEATANAIRTIAAATMEPGGKDAVALQIAQQYVEAFGQIAKEGNTILLPANASDPASMVAQALAIYGNVQPSVGASPAPALAATAHGRTAEHRARDGDERSSV